LDGDGLRADKFGDARCADIVGPPLQAFHILKAAAVAEERGWKLAEERAKWYLEQLQANKMKVLPPPPARKTGLEKVGEQLTADWLKKAGPDGEAVIAAYKK
jgi:TRAP-type C4-dicarboxylate transport system substrate-binding protein